MKFDKLVRDKIPEIIKNRGENAITRIANDDEYWQKLREKLSEEVEEFLQHENEEELADILEVIYAICNFKNFDKQKLEKLRIKKLNNRGGFNEKIILEETSPR